MIQRFVLLFLLVSSSVTGVLSQYSVSGRVMDSSENKYLENAVILVMQEKDSMLVSFSRTSSDGMFNIAGLRNGSYLLLVSLKNYTDYTRSFFIAGDQGIDLGVIPLITVMHLLDEVIVRQTISKIRIKGDTTEYRADSFHVEPNATVEDLLKVLPGITVDAKGNITANGKSVSEVLVDGEPFFSDDPVLVTRNLRSEIVGKVQVYDKKSDREAFSGVSTTPPKTVIDLKIKPNKKNGYFGNAVLGAGTGGYFNTEFMYNRFKGKEKISFFGIATNTSGAGLSDLNIERFSDNSLFTNVKEMADPFDSWSGSYNGEGVPLLQSAGIHYNNKWNGDTQSVNTNFKLAHLGVEGLNNTDYVQTLANGQTLETSSQDHYHNKRLVNRINGNYQLKLDSTATLKLSLDGNISQKELRSAFESQTLEDGKNLINSQSRTIAFKNNNNTFSGDLIWLKKLKKQRRTLSVAVSAEKHDINSNGYVNAITNLYSVNGSASTAEITDQYKVNQSGQYHISATLSYTEPISPSAIVNIEAGQAYYNGNSSIKSFNRSIDHSYSDLDSATSSNFTLTAPRQKLNLQYVLTKKKYRLTIGNEYNNDIYRQDNKRNATQIKRNFAYNNPLILFGYSPDAQTSFSISYRGSTLVPSFEQLQPLLLNINPVIIFVGNPSLEPSYTHGISINYLKFKMVKNQALSFNLMINKINRAIGQSSTIDSFGRTLYSWVNINGNYFGNAAVNFSTQLSRLRAFVAVRGEVEINRNGSRVNGKDFTMRTATYTVGVFIRTAKEGKYSFSIGSNFSYVNADDNTQSFYSNSFATVKPSFNIDIYPRKKVQIHLDGNLLARQQVEGFQTVPTVALLNGWLGVKFLKKENLLLKASINNLLDANTLNRRYVGSNYSSQTNYNVIGRYLMVSAAWNFMSNASK